MKTREQVEQRREKFRNLQALGYDGLDARDEHPAYFRGWDHGVLMLI